MIFPYPSSCLSVDWPQRTVVSDLCSYNLVTQPGMSSTVVSWPQIRKLWMSHSADRTLSCFCPYLSQPGCPSQHFLYSEKQQHQSIVCMGGALLCLQKGEIALGGKFCPRTSHPYAFFLNGAWSSLSASAFLDVKLWPSVCEWTTSDPTITPSKKVARWERKLWAWKILKYLWEEQWKLESGLETLVQFIRFNWLASRPGWLLLKTQTTWNLGSSLRDTGMPNLEEFDEFSCIPMTSPKLGTDVLDPLLPCTFPSVSFWGLIFSILSCTFFFVF